MSSMYMAIPTTEPEITFLNCSDNMSEQMLKCSDIPPLVSHFSALMNVVITYMYFSATD